MAGAVDQRGVGRGGGRTALRARHLLGGTGPDCWRMVTVGTWPRGLILAGAALRHLWRFVTVMSAILVGATGTDREAMLAASTVVYASSTRRGGERT